MFLREKNIEMYTTVHREVRGGGEYRGRLTVEVRGISYNQERYGDEEERWKVTRWTEAHASTGTKEMSLRASPSHVCVAGGRCAHV